MTKLNSSLPPFCNASQPFVDSIPFKIIIIFHILIGTVSALANGLLIAAVWRVSIFHSNLRWLLINLSINLFWFASGIAIRAMYFLIIAIVGNACLFPAESITCKKWELLYVTPFLNIIYSLIAVSVERLWSTIRYQNYDQSSKIPWLACLFIPIIWIGTLANQLAVLSSLSSSVLPFCMAFIFTPKSAVRGAMITNATLETVAVFLISVLYFWNIRKRNRAVNVALAHMGNYSLASRFQIIQNVDVNKLLLPSIIAHACAHIPYMAFLSLLLFGLHLPLELKVNLMHCDMGWLTAYGAAHAWLAFSRHPKLKDKFQQWMPERVLRVIMMGKKEKKEIYNVSAAGDLHFDFLEKMWETNRTVIAQSNGVKSRTNSTTGVNNERKVIFQKKPNQAWVA